MVVWVFLSVALAVAGLLVLTVCALRVHAAARGLAVELERTRRRLQPQHSALTSELRHLERRRMWREAPRSVRSGESTP
ncbi:MAG: hypothetical protein GEV11_18930 [Streptosporangiales bacterium]|nr:hypothetical protein [Streptosporangiales bacterium]